MTRAEWPVVMDARFVAAARHASELPAAAFAEVAFAGRSNVGKSSVINALVGRRKLVRTSSTPGQTRGVHLFRVALRGATIDLVDLPGYGYAQRSKSERRAWGTLVETFLRERASLRAVVVIADARRGLEEDDLGLVDFVTELDKRAIVVATKLDKLPASRRKPALEAIARASEHKPIGFSAETGEGREPLWRAVLEAAAIQLPT